MLFCYCWLVAVRIFIIYLCFSSALWASAPIKYTVCGDCEYNVHVVAGILAFAFITIIIYVHFEMDTKMSRQSRACVRQRAAHLLTNRIQMNKYKRFWAC